MISTSVCVACGPAIEIARSPESRVSMNASVITVNATRMPSARRRMMRRNIAGPATLWMMPAGQASHQSGAARKSTVCVIAVQDLLVYRSAAVTIRGLICPGAML